MYCNNNPRHWTSEERSDAMLVAGHDKRGANLSAKQTAHRRQTRGICLDLEIFIISVAVNVEGTVYNNMHGLIGIFSE